MNAVKVSARSYQAWNHRILDPVLTGPENHVTVSDRTGARPTVTAAKPIGNTGHNRRRDGGLPCCRNSHQQVDLVPCNPAVDQPFDGFWRNLRGAHEVNSVLRWHQGRLAPTRLRSIRTEIHDAASCSLDVIATTAAPETRRASTRASSHVSTSASIHPTACAEIFNLRGKLGS